MSSKNDQIPGGGFHHVAMRVRDFDASLKFYTQTLGFVPVLQWGGENQRAVMLDMGNGGRLEIFSGGDGEPKAAEQLLHFAVATSDTDAAFKRVADSGAEIISEPRTVDIPSDPPARVRIAFFKGPDGETVELFQDFPA